MLRHYHEAYRGVLAALSDDDLSPLYARTVGDYPLLAHLIGEEIARRREARRPYFTSTEVCPSEFAAAA